MRFRSRFSSPPSLVLLEEEEVESYDWKERRQTPRARLQGDNKDLQNYTLCEPHLALWDGLAWEKMKSQI